MAVLQKACGLSYMAGAPRHKHRGAVFELQKEGEETNFMPVLDGEQVPAGEGPQTPPSLQVGDQRPRGGQAPGRTVDWGPSPGRARASALAPRVSLCPRFPTVGVGLLSRFPVLLWGTG